MHTVRRELTAREIRHFGWITLGGFLVIGAFFWLKGAGWSFHDALAWHGAGWQKAALVLWAVGAGFAVICNTSHPMGLRLYIAWMTMAVAIGTVMSVVMLSLMFLIILPVFSLIRLSDPLKLKRKAAGSYWEDHPPHEPTIERMSRMF